MISPDDIAADRAVIDAATDGPWRVSEYDDTEVWADRDAAGWDSFLIATLRTRLNPDPEFYEADAAFIAAARTGWPRALDALEVMADAVLDEMARAEKAEAAIARVRALCEYVDMLDASEYDAGRMAALDAVLAALDGGASA